ncbi:dipeptide epimerase [Lacihabitans soyangensis]|uniref:Dipeptide epimerase n=1 Tax=Lacihabitans soyangensis TaxID=869394 RepID=A0AAE3H2N3_9BACT|nr:dipeptide epimerase [Lacihabitans soyangensis]MCP9763190.1 dipeptide epimerase [Lacihabitans soyangensis]
MKIKTHTISLKSKYPFRIAHGVRNETDTFIVELSYKKFTGFGEATPVPYYGITPEVMNSVIAENKEMIENIIWEHPGKYWEALNPFIGHNHFVQCAIDIAAYDIWGQKNGKPVHKMLGLDNSKVPFSDYTLGIDEIPMMIEKMKEFDFPIYKIKLGTLNDIEIVKALRNETEAIFRVDANTGWTVEETIKNSEELSNLGVEFIEQPLKSDDFEGMKEVIKHTKLPIIADESCVVEADVERCIGHFSGVNIKLAKCGGITPAIRMIKTARAAKMKVMMGCMTESSIGISAIAQLLPLLDYVDMDGAMLISNDPAEGVKLENGKVIYCDRNGIGAILR